MKYALCFPPYILRQMKKSPASQANNCKHFTPSTAPRLIWFYLPLKLLSLYPKHGSLSLVFSRNYSIAYVYGAPYPRYTHI